MKPLLKPLGKLGSNGVISLPAQRKQVLKKRCFGWVVWALAAFGLHPCSAQKTDKLLVDILKKSPELFGPILKNPAQYDVQILYTQINRDAQNRPTFKTYRYRVDKNRYFYPASTVKLPAVLLSLEKLNQLKKAGRAISRDTPMLTDSAFSGQTAVRRDTSAKDGLPSVAHYAKKILLVSDNDAFNRLYEFMGQCDINERLYAKGYRNLRIVHRLSVPLTTEQNRRTNPVRFVNGEQVVYEQSMQSCERTPHSDSLIQRGTGYLKGDSLIKQPFDFTEKNYFALEDQQAILKAVLFPEAVPARQRFDLSSDDYRFVYQYLSQLPRETTYPRYDSTFYDSYCKFLLAGDSKKMFPRQLRIFNKVGDAYGYLIDNAYITDFDSGVEFMLSAVIYCNKDGIFNDNAYDYDSVGYPFMGNLGRVIFDYESRRKRPNPPKFDRFHVSYDK